MTDYFDNVDQGYSGSRSSAIEQGEILDLSAQGRNFGFKWPVAITKAVSDSELDNELVVARAADRVCLIGPRADRMRFRVNGQAFQLIAHPGDDGEPVLTIRVAPNL
ncbi:MAG: hypothetical protein OXG15_10285 [Gammaproteobacteria bacterium]|nr:hypothetical protein [Gammaproteobacteria bacterium]